MKSAFTFFLLIVFLLTGGNPPTYANASLVKSHLSGQSSIKKIQQTVPEVNRQVIFQSGNSGSEKQKDLVVFVADEDENEDSIKRCSPQTIRFAQVFYAFISNYNGSKINCCNYAYKLPCYTGRSRYIKHRSLII